MTVRVLCGLLVTLSVVARCPPALAGDWTPLVIPDQRAAQAGFVFDFGEADGRNGHIWQGPIVITDPQKRTCRVSEDVELVTDPATLWRGRLLYVNAFSGSTFRLFVVDIRTCRIAWASPVFDGRSSIVGGNHLRLSGLAPWRIGPDGLPTRRPAR